MTGEEETADNADNDEPSLQRGRCMCRKGFRRSTPAAPCTGKANRGGVDESSLAIYTKNKEYVSCCVEL